MSPAVVIRVLIVDDHLIVQEGIAAIINEEDDMTVIAQAKHGIEAIEIVS